MQFSDKSLMVSPYFTSEPAGMVNELMSSSPSQKTGAEVVPASKAVDTTHLPGIGDEETIYGCRKMLKFDPADVSKI